MTASRIAAVGHYQPAETLTNADLEQLVDTNDEWIRTRVGIVERRIARTESVADLAVQASAKALASSGRAANEIDMVVVATTTAIDRCPNTAARVAAALGLGSPAVLDVNTACSGYSHALAVADHAVRAGAARAALVVASEKMSDVTDWTDRSTCILIGDGAGAAVIEACDDAEWGVGPVFWGSAPDKSRMVLIEGDVPRFSQEGQAVYRWVTGEVAALARRACDAAGVTPDQLAGFVPHQANLRMIEPLARQLGLAGKVIARDVVNSGNTSAASVGIALSKLVESGELVSGDLALLFGFGGGLAYAGQVVRCP
ncbi:beta-ketoacyl-ACP synthase III [Actinospica robiniae]|uniref:beta-ketoacyl-ACP synthase III n=1 Tax=Actinospica robiniae TaxID=304901 RepID=UPI0003FD01BE|nr:beta-ketoacyl-ACP synthase III [Actinospica robiniae]